MRFPKLYQYLELQLDPSIASSLQPAEGARAAQAAGQQVLALLRESFGRIPVFTNALQQDDRSTAATVAAGGEEDLLGLLCTGRPLPADQQPPQQEQPQPQFLLAMLRQGGALVTAAVFRCHGDRFAELPFAATRISSRRQGRFRLLLSCLQQALQEAGVGPPICSSILRLLHPPFLIVWRTSTFPDNPLQGLRRTAASLARFSNANKDVCRQSCCSPFLSYRPAA